MNKRMFAKLSDRIDHFGNTVIVGTATTVVCTCIVTAAYILITKHTEILVSMIATIVVAYLVGVLVTKLKIAFDKMED